MDPAETPTTPLDSSAPAQKSPGQERSPQAPRKRLGANQTGSWQWDFDVSWQPSQVKLDLLGEHARWADEVRRATDSMACAYRAATAVNESRWWQMVLASTMVLDVAACIVYRTYTAFSIDAVGEACRYVVEALVSVVAMLDLTARLLVVDREQDCNFSFALEMGLQAAMVVCCFCDLAVAWQLPFAVYYVVRILFRCRRYLDIVVDAAVDRKLAQALGDIFYISPDNATARPSDGLFVLEKTHVRPQAFEDIHLPVTIKGGFVELVYIDLDLAPRRPKNRPDLRESIVQSNGLRFRLQEEGSAGSAGSGSSEDTEGDEGDVERGDLRRKESVEGDAQDIPTAASSSRNVSKVCIELHNLLLVLGPGKSLGNEAWNREDIIAMKDNLVQIIAKRTELLSGKKKEQQEQPQTPPQSQQQAPSTILGKLRHHLQTGALSRLDLSHVSVDIRNVEVRFEDFNLLPKPMSCGFHVAHSSIRLDSTHASALRTPLFRAFPGWLHERRSSGQYGGHAVDTEGDHDWPPVRIGASIHPLVAWCDLESSSRREAFRAQSCTHLFSAERPEISKLVSAFKRRNAKQKLKLATIAVLDSADAGDRDHPHHLMQEKILDHRFVLMPLVVSLHAMSLDSEARVLTPEGELGLHPEQVSDLEVPQIAVQLDRDQAANLTALVRLIDDWVKMDAWISRKPPTRLRHTPPRFQHRVAMDWWAFAAREIAWHIAPNGSLDAFLGARRMAYYSQAYQQIVYERCAAAAFRRQRRHVLDTYDKQIKQIQLSLPLKVIINRRTKAKQEHAAGPKEFRWNEDYVRTLQSGSNDDHNRTGAASAQLLSPLNQSKTFLQSPRSKLSLTKTLTKSKTAGPKAATQGLANMDMSLAQKFHLDRRLHGEPAQACVRIGRISVALLDPPDSESGGVRREMVRLRARGVDLVWTRRAPKEHFRQLQCCPARVINHVDEGTWWQKWEALRAAEGRATRTRWSGTCYYEDAVSLPYSISSMVHCAGLTTLLGPADGIEEHGGGWHTLEVSVDFFSVLYCKAPTSLPNLRKVLVRNRARGESTASTAALRPGESGGGQSMFRLRAIYHGAVPAREDASHAVPDTSHEGEAKGVVVVHCCALRVVNYQPVVEAVLRAVRLPPGRAWEDPLQLMDIRRRLKAERGESRSAAAVARAFEKVTGLRKAAGSPAPFYDVFDDMVDPDHQGWRCIAVTAGISGTDIRQLTDHSYLVQHFDLPPGMHLLQRQSEPPYVGLGGTFTALVAPSRREAGAPEREDTFPDEDDISDEQGPVFTQRPASPFAERFLQGISRLRQGTIAISPRAQDELPREYCCSCMCESIRERNMITVVDTPLQDMVDVPRFTRVASLSTIGGPLLPQSGNINVELKVLRWEDALAELEERVKTDV